MVGGEHSIKMLGLQLLRFGSEVVLKIFFTKDQLASFQTIRKLANTGFQYYRGVIYSIYQIHSYKKHVFFPHERNFTLIYGSFSCLIIVLFGPIFMEYFVLFSNALSILKPMRCNLNLPKLDTLTLLSSNCRACALKLSKHLKKGQNMFFILILPTTPLP